MEEKAGIQIGKKAFIQSVLILAALMACAGILTRVVDPGVYQRFEIEGRMVIDPDSFSQVDAVNYPVWRWLIAPLEVLGGPNGLTLIVIIFFILMVGGSFAVLERSGILQLGIARIVQRFGKRKYLLLLLVSFFFMALGAFFGIFEEVIPLVPLVLALSYYLGWDAMVGLGMSILATNLGFSAAITNPFTIGVAQRLAGLPLFSGAGLRILIFLTIYLVFAIFLVNYARKVERDPTRSPVYQEDLQVRSRYSQLPLSAADPGRGLQWAMVWVLACLVLILLVLFGGPLLPVLTDLALPLVGLLFLVAGLGAGFLVGTPARQIFKALGQGIAGIAPGIILILMAASVNHIVQQGSVIDPILDWAASLFSGASPFAAAVLIYVLALLIEFFISSGSAKAFLLMPILLPLADLVGVTRQLTVTAYCFGDGFSNLAYPTNPVLLIVLGLTVVSYPKWLKWSLKLWFWVILVTLVFLGIGVAIGYGPF